jgi:GAF domain-containing protein
MDLEDICNLVLEEARTNLAVENGSVMLLNEEKNQLYIKAAFGDEAQDKVNLAIGEGIAGDVIKSGKAELVNNVSSDPRFKAGSLEIRSLICAPLKYNGACFGVLNVSTGSEKNFTLDNLKLLHSFARYASITLKNAMIISDLKYATDEVLRQASILGMY